MTELPGSRKKCKKCNSKNVSPGDKYCSNCGCSICSQHKGEKEIFDNFGLKICQREKKCRDFFKQNCSGESNKLERQQRQELKTKQSEIDQQLEQEVKSVSAGFYEQIKETLKKIADFKHKFIDKKIAADGFFANVCQQIDNCPSSLADDTDTKKEEGRLIYKVNNSIILPSLFSAEKNTLCTGAKKYNDDIAERERERERAKQQIIQAIKIELNNSLTVNITELDSRYHNYENLAAEELTAIKSAIIEAIKNERAKKKLTNLLKSSNNCSDSDLGNFIQSLEEFNSISASPYQKNSYSACQSEVNTALNKLRQRGNNLSEEAKLENYGNNSIHNFDNGLKEAENLSLTSSDPFQDFKQDIKKCKTKEAIENKENEAYQHVLTLFKEKVKQELGAEQQNNEYQEINKSRNFEEVKLGRDKIRQGRHKSDTPSPQTPPSQDNNSPSVPSPESPKHDKGNDGSERNQQRDKNDDDLPNDLTKMDLEEIKQKIQSKIESLLAKSGIKLTPDYYKDFCAGKECGKKFLWENLNDKEKVIEFYREMEKLIKERMNQNLDNTSSPKKSNFGKISIISVSLILLLPLFFLAKYVVKKLRLRKNKT